MIVNRLDKTQIIVHTSSTAEETLLKKSGFSLAGESERLYSKQFCEEVELVSQLDSFASMQVRFLDNGENSPKSRMIAYQIQGLVKRDFVGITHQDGKGPLIKRHPYSKIVCPKSECICKKCILNSGSKCLGCCECDEHKVAFPVTDCENSQPEH